MQAATRLQRDPGNRSRAVILWQLPAPIRFFGLLLLVVEAAFGSYLTIVRPVERVAMTFGCIMGGIFVIAAIAVTLLTMRSPDPSQKDEMDSEAEFLEGIKRSRIAYSLLLKYSRSSNKSPEAISVLLDNLVKVLVPSKKKQKKLSIPKAKAERDVYEG